MRRNEKDVVVIILRNNFTSQNNIQRVDTYIILMGITNTYTASLYYVDTYIYLACSKYIMKIIGKIEIIFEEI